MKYAVTIMLGVAAVILAAILILPARFRLHAVSPDHNLRVEGLCFKGSKPHRLDGTLRLIIYRDGSVERKIQTTIPWSRELGIGWIDAPRSEGFAVRRAGVTLLIVSVKGGGITCLEGQRLLADDPYEEKTPNSTGAGKPATAPEPKSR